MDERTFDVEVWQSDLGYGPTISVTLIDPVDGSMEQVLLSVSEAKRLRTLLNRTIFLAEAGHTYPKE